MMCGMILSMMCEGDIVVCGCESDVRVVVRCMDDVWVVWWNASGVRVRECRTSGVHVPCCAITYCM